MSGREDKKSAVPKFSSFKAKPADSTPTPESVTKGKDDVDKSHRSSRHHRHRHRSHRHGGKLSGSASRSPSPKRPRTRDRSRSPRERHGRDLEVRRKGNPDAPAQPSKPARDLASDLFVIDKKGDPLIPKFGVDRYKQAQFYRPSRERVLGAEGYLYIHRDGPREEFSIRKPGEFYGVSLRDKHAFRTKLRQAEPQMLKASKRALLEVDGPEEDFISLKPPRKRGRDSSEDERGPDYRSILGKAKANDAFADNVDSESSDEDMGAGADPLKERSIELTRRVKEHPDDIAAWLELINHQDLLLKASASGQDPTANEIRSFAEIKLSMYEKALAQVKSPHQKEQLLVGQMRAGAKVWDGPMQETRWEKIGKQVEGSLLLWKAHLDFKLSNIVAFQYNTVKKMFLDRLALLNSKVNEEVIRVKQKMLYSELIYVFLRATRYFYDCGYKELSVASWQALLELNLYGPEIPNPAGAIPESFQEFWESEIPRIGEPGALGWNHFIATSDDSTVPDAALPDPRPDGPQSRDAYKAWATEELHQAKKARMPGRTLDEDTVDDPFRLIMYSDLEGIPFTIPSNLLPELKGELLDAYLTFCHLPPLSSNRLWKADPHLAPRDGAFERLVRAGPQRFADSDDSTRTPPEFAKEAITPAIAPKTICSLLVSLKASNKNELPVELSWVLLTLKSLVMAGHEELAKHYLALEWISDAGAVKKAAKGLIKKYPQNIGLYNLYGLLEWANGNPAVARTVLSSASRLSQSSGSESTLVLWLSWAWIEFVEGAPTPSILARLCLISDGDNIPSAAFVLKKKLELQTESEDAFRRDDIDGFVLNAKLLSLAEYLSSEAGSEPKSEKQGSISAAMDVVWRHSERLLARGRGECPQHEELLEFAAMLLFRHTILGPYRRAYLSDQFRRCVQLFPTNVNFLALLDWVASTLRIDDEFRNVLSDLVLIGNQDSVALRVCAITHELGPGGSTYAAATAFSRALDSDAARLSPWLWSCYIRFCQVRAEGLPKDAGKRTYYRAMNSCPWAKDLAMEAFTTLIRRMDSSELKSGYNSMELKGMRIHVAMEEFMEKRKREKEKERSRENRRR
ncbi:hypothetical protein jhhlp_001230 [Lomentospora prolificans]|uniref:DUF1740-domain-containing protein n=1 Tax=Lomentospora prolificans TaxID=41688 RepID=A0A2N3NHM0_9PEZI|nr:hypothetical protein jhhlp_001230 [Lomentospora prolificans]